MPSPRDEVLEALRARAEEVLGGVADPERGWPHAERVYGLARRLAREEEADRFVVGAAALLHDLGDAGDTPRAELLRHPLPAATVGAVLDAIAALANPDAAPGTLEARVLQDAHRLDALGAFGIARILTAGGPTAATAGDRRVLHEPVDPFALLRDLEPDQFLTEAQVGSTWSAARA